MSEILVIGHRNPDTDAICSAVGYAEFKRRTGTREAVAARCGETNDRIDFVLRTFGVPAPKFVSDVAPRVRDVMAAHPISVAPDTSAGEALAILEDRGKRVLPVLAADGTCMGLVSVLKMSRFFYPAPDRLFDSRRVVATLNSLVRTLGGELVHGIDPDREEDLVMMISAMSLGSFVQRLPIYQPEKLLVIVGDREDVQQVAVDEKIRVLIVTGGLPVEKTVLSDAILNGVSIIKSPHDTATTAILCRAAISVRHLLTEHVLTFDEGESLGGIKNLAAESQFQAFPVVNEHRQVIGMLSKSDFLKKIARKLILVDHNELSQAVPGADQVEIMEIIDHHRIGALTTAQPILFRNEPVGSTSTIVADCFQRSGVELPQHIAGLLLAGLVSDTLNLTSPTTTPRDAEILSWLEKITRVNAARFTEKLFESGSVLISRTPEQAITTDCKEYVEDDRRFSVAQIEEIGFDQFYKRKSEVLTALAEFQRNKEYFFAALLVTDVVRQSSLLAVSGDEGFLKQIDYTEVEPGIYELPGVVSRKKQLLPFLTHCLRRAG